MFQSPIVKELINYFHDCMQKFVFKELGAQFLDLSNAKTLLKLAIGDYKPKLTTKCEMATRVLRIDRRG